MGGCQRKTCQHLQLSDTTLYSNNEDPCSPIMGKQTTKPAISSILSHTNASRYPANFDDFQILSSSYDSYELMIHESLLINKYRLNLNAQGSSIPLNLFLIVVHLICVCNVLSIVPLLNIDFSSLSCG